MLESVHSPQDLKKLNQAQMTELAGEIRRRIIDVTLKNGGHLASNLGAVELTLAMHYVFDAPRDKIVFDVGHQCYTHKLITGRGDRFDTLRKKGGINGFPSHDESEFDTFDAGHSSAAISAALGLARARDLKKEDYRVIAVVGDGAMGGGMAFEALNDAGDDLRKTDLIILLNDNEMSISRNVGALSSQFSKLRAKSGYIRSKRRVKRALRKVSPSGKLLGTVARLRDTVRVLLMGNTVFDTLGIKYLGPVDGHSLKDMIDMFERVKDVPGPVLIHVVTCKGCGFPSAEKDPEAYHGVSPQKEVKGTLLAQQIGSSLLALAEENANICAVTAGMTYNTGLKEFSEKFPDRFFDTGIAEQHALTMAGGLAKGGLRPFVVIYGTFLQRGFDQIFHDICLQKLPVTVCIDHAGLTGSDGATHQGVFDLGFLCAMPGLTVLAPRDARELDRMLTFAARAEGPVAIRYPKGTAVDLDGAHPFDGLSWDVLCSGSKGTLITFGACCEEALSVAREEELTLCDARCLKPLDTAFLDKLEGPVFVLEDNAASGGLAEHILYYYAQSGKNVRVIPLALKDRFVSVGSVSEQRAEHGLDPDSLRECIRHEN